MGDELSLSPATLAEITGELGRGRAAIEDCASSSPRSVDAGELTAMLTGMLAKVIDNASTVSETIGGCSAQAGEAGSHFWEVDADVASTYAGR